MTHGKIHWKFKRRLDVDGVSLPAAGSKSHPRRLFSFLIVLLSLVSGGAAAEWVLLGRDDTISVYYDPNSLRWNLGLLTGEMWVVHDYSVIQKQRNVAYLSARIKYEYDCKREQIRELYSSWHSGSMTKGDVVSVFSIPTSWQPVPSGTYASLQWKILCGER